MFSFQTFTITAIDGDFGVNDDIEYFLDGFEDCKTTNKLFRIKSNIIYNISGGDEVSIDQTTGVITVTGIDRDAYDREMYTFTAIAKEVHDPHYTKNQSITFYVIDINDHSPYFYDPENHLLTFDIREELYTPLDDTVAVKDIDTVRS